MANDDDINEDLDFALQVAEALDLDDSEYSSLVQEIELGDDTEYERDFYELEGDWDEWLEYDVWYEVTASYSDEE